MKIDKRMDHVLNVGDIDVFADDDFVRVTVDQRTVIFIPRNGHGFQALAKKLYDLS